MRYSRMQYENTRAQQRSFKGIWLFVVIIAAAVGIYLIGAAKVGDFLSQKIVTPVVSWLTGEKPQQEPSGSANTAVVPSSAAGETVSKDLKMEGGTIYALQVGLYTEEKNAQDASAQLVSKGGAGYILQTQEGMRVLIAGYATREDAENVQQRLASEQQMETSIYEMGTQELIVSVPQIRIPLQRLSLRLPIRISIIMIFWERQFPLINRSLAKMLCSKISQA